MKVVPSIANALDYVGRVRVALIVAFLAGAVLVLPDQMLEIYIIYAQALIGVAAARATGQTAFASADFPLVQQFALGILGTVLLSTAIWICTLRLLLVSRGSASENLLRPIPRHEFTATLVSVLPILALILGFQSAVSALGNDGGQTINLGAEQLWLNATSVVLVTLVALNSLVYFALLRHRALALVGALFSLPGFILICLVLLAFMALIAWQPVVVPVWLGTLAIVAMFHTMLAYILTACASVTARHKIPVISVLVILGVLFAWRGWSDNHRVRYAFVDRAPPSLEESFIAWFKARRDREHFQSKGISYPIYFVAAEGGGLYAALHVANFMARMQDQCPGFAQHTFGISSVSGGSLGAAVFSALASEKAGNEAWRPCGPDHKQGAFQDFVRNYFSNDLLSPLAAASMFPDFLQRFVPVAFHRFDRARALETSFEQAWSSAKRADAASIPDSYSNPFAAPLGHIWDTSKSAPALFLNATSVTSGARVTLSHIHFDATPTTVHIGNPLKIYCSDGALKAVEVPVATAVSLSARFPWLTPAGWLERAPVAGRGLTDADCVSFAARLYLADGGYFENSGLESAIELVQRLRRVIAKHPETFGSGPGSAEITIIKVLAADKFAKRWWTGADDLTDRGPGDLATPMTAMLHTRQARTRAVDSRTAFNPSYYREGEYAEELLNKIGSDYPTLGHLSVLRGYYRKMLDGTFFLPLGWHLSSSTRQSIEGLTTPLDVVMRCLIRNDLDGAVTGPWESRTARCLPARSAAGGG